MGDARLQFLIENISVLGDIKDKNNLEKDLERNKAVRDFLDDARITTLLAAVQNGSVSVTCNLAGLKENSFGAQESFDLLFIKRFSEPLTAKNMKDIIDVHTLKGNPVSGLLASLQGLWCPLLTEAKDDENVSSRVKQLLKDLESTLRASAPTMASGSSRDNGDVNLENVSGINTVADEIHFWLRQKESGGGGRRGGKSSSKGLAESVDRALVEIAPLTDVKNLDIYAMSNMIENCETCLNNIWQSEDQSGNGYPQSRMMHLMERIGNCYFLFVQQVLGDVPIWKQQQSGSTRLLLQSCINLLQKWCELPRKLYKYWKGGRWRGDPYEDSNNLGFLNRLEKVYEILTIADELATILSEGGASSADASSYRLDRLFDPFAEINPVLYSSSSNRAWERAVREFEKSIEPIQSAIVNKFRREITPFMNDVTLLLEEFRKYYTLLKREDMLKLITSERETLLSLLKEKINSIENLVDRGDYMPGKDSGSNGNDSFPGDVTLYSGAKLTSPLIIGLSRLRQLKSSMKEISNVSDSMLTDLQNYGSFKKQFDKVAAKIEGEEKQRFTAWLNDMTDRYESNDDSLRLSGSLLDWKDGILVVTFPETLVKFLRDYRALSEMGYPVPAPASSGRDKQRRTLGDCAVDAERFYRYGMLLKKTANFYNSLSEQIIDVQEQLLLGSLTAFAGLVSSNKKSSKNDGLNWSNPSECESFIRVLQDAAEKLATENRSLRKVHEWLCFQTISLMQIDLHRQSELWKSKWRMMKEKMISVKSKYSEKDCKNWILHWDHQVFKALEVSYRIGLEYLNDNISDMKVELVFNNKILDLKPPIEQIRQSYYRELKKFITIPYLFDGFTGANAQIFKKMGLRNSKATAKVFEKAELFFKNLTEFIARYQDWTLLAQVDLDIYIESTVKTSEDYLVNFKMLKNKRKEIDKLPDVEKIDCCTISLVPFKSFLDDLLLKIGDILLVNLRRSLMEDFKEVDSFLENAKEKLNSRPRTVDEIGEAKKQWKEFDNKKTSMMSVSKNCSEKKKLLLQYAPGTAIDISEIISKMSNLDGEGGRWDDFEIAMEAHNDIIEKEKEVLKGFLEEEEVNLNVEIEKFTSKWKQLKPQDTKSWDPRDIQKIFDSLEDWKKQFHEIEARTTKHSEARINFGMRNARFDGMTFLQNDLINTAKSWDMLKEYMAEEKKMADEDWISFTNIYVIQDFAVKWAETLKATFTRGSYDSVAEYIVSKVEKMKKSIQALKYCKSDAFKEDHWTELLQGKLLLPKELRVEKLKVEHFLSRLDILMDPATLNFVKGLQARALGEVQIREAMHELRAWELSAELKFLTQDESGRSIPLIKEWKDLFTEIGDKQSLLSSLKESPFFKAFADVGLALEAKMTSLDFILHTLNSIQRKWVYLEPIFARGALPAEESRFRRVDENFKDIMMTIVKDPKLFYFADEQYFPRLNDNCRVMLDQLERCQKALTEFLEAKRSAMPRFYFIGDDDLLEILGQAKNPAVIQSHLKKLFQGIHKVKFDADCKHITAMISSANEIVELEQPVQVSEKVEDWLDQLAQEMRSTLASLLEKCLASKQFDWKYPSQILCLSQAIKFTQQAENAIQEGPKALQALAQQLTHELRDFTSHDLSSEPLLQLKMKSLVMDLVHHLDVIDQLLKKKTNRLSDWAWSKQLRYYFVKHMAVVRMHDAEFEYTYEYQGNAPKLVHTPLTDRCYLTLTQGMRMGFGGNPYGPAGTGKTESVKALASCLGRQVLVFNCDEALESASMIRIFIGIVKCGAWGCFDEFNRLKEDQLSAISQQIQIIQDAIKTRSSPITLLSRSVEVNFNSGIFVTLNPAGKGYGGRSRLPDNLKALFRPVAMGAPDNELIAEVSLVTEGFTQSKDLASKIVSLFKLSKQLLSNQQHYDWGLRALKAVLNSGGRLIQTYKLNGNKVGADMEYEILIKAVRVNTLSKLTFADTTKFLALIGDVFPGRKSDDISGGELEAAIKEVMKEKPFYLVEDSAQIKKMIQLKESLDQRMGCVIVGPSGCGKSTLWRVLKAAMIKCGEPVVTYVMNPKSMPRQRLLGHMDIDTREWSDGVLTDAARKVVKESSEVHCWIICDGDVDPEWIESLNSVLDDNHLLTLPNGERISFGSNVNFLFETHDLRFASPATVSRMGMIFLSDEDLDVGRLLQKWLSVITDDKQRMSLSSWIDEFFYKALDWVLKNGESVVDTTLVGTVMNGLSQLKDIKTKHEFICGLIRGLGGNLSLSQRSSFAKEVFQWMGERPPDTNNPLDCTADGNAFRAFSAPRPNDLEPIQIKDIGYSAVIPTITVQRTLAMMESWLTNMEPFILVGPEGCGKSMIINHAVRRKRNIGVATLHCNAQTTSDDVISKITQTCSLFSSADGRVYRPRDCERLVLYLKDINLPKPDMYDTCQLIAFLQQIITFGGFYDEALEFLRLERIQIVASINAATTVGRHPLSTRFTAVVRIGVLDYPENNELTSIYDTFLTTVLKGAKLFDARWQQSSQDRARLAEAIVEIYNKVREKFTVDDRRHYLFTPRDMTQLVKNICRYSVETENMLDIIAHESCRIFRDRLVDNEALGKFDQNLSTILRSSFRHTLPASDIFFSSLSLTRGPGGSGGAANKKSEGKEADGGSSSSSSENSVGGLLNKMKEEEFKKLVSQGILYYEREERDLNMLLFSETLEHVAHIDRVLSSRSSGHLLLVGKSGVGRRNAVTIATYMLGYKFFTPLVTKEYGSKQFSENVKSVLDTAGLKGEDVVFVIEDYQITTDAILETINSLISSGEAPGLYTHEELEPLLAGLRKAMEESDGSARTPYEFFLSRIRKHLHIVLLMDPNHPRFLYRCESNPALYAQCTVLWIGEWRSQSLKEIPMLMEGIKDILMKGGDGAAGKGEGKFSEGKGGEGKSTAGGGRGGESKGSSTLNMSYDEEDGDSSKRLSVNEDLIEMVTTIHNSCLMTPLFATPKDYITFLKSWHSLFMMKKKELLIELGHLEAGLSKLESAAAIVHDLRTNAAQQREDLRKAQADADRAMEEITKAISSSTDRRNEVSEVKKVVAENEAKTLDRKREIEDELSEIQPVLEKAKQAVGGIKSEHLNEIKSFSIPPEPVNDVLAAVLTLFGVQDLSWQSMKKFLSNRGMKDDILNYDAKRMSPETRKSVAKLIKKNQNSFDEAVITRASQAAAPMAAWVLANIRYSLVMEKIQPLQEELDQEVAKLEQSQKRLRRCEEELQEIDEKITKLKREFTEKTTLAERLKNNLQIAGTTLDKAEKLIGQLSGEQQRWKTQSIQLRSDLTKLPMKMLLAAGFATYLAKAPEDVRADMINKWQEITNLKDSFIFKRVMSTESELLTWKSMGLPSDDLSQENGLVICNSTDRIPFIIDPASAATNWLRAMLANDKTRPLEVVTQFDQRFMQQVELSVRFGKTLLILEADGLEPALYPLVRKDLCHQGPRYVVTVGEKALDYNEAFRMYLVTRNPSPEIPPDAASLLSIVNFTVTRSGLEGQLLGLAIQHEQPELERAKGEMLKREEDFKVQLAKLEKGLLEALATAEGNLLENTALIESLTRTKEKSAEIEEALVKSAEASVKLDQQREVYRPFAYTGAKLYFLVKHLQNINHMYQFALSSFLTIFKKALSSSSSSNNNSAGESKSSNKKGSQESDTEMRLLALTKDMEIRVLYYVGRALFKADRPMFALHLVHSMHKEQFQAKEWEIFTGALVASVSDALPRGYPTWAPPERKDAYRLLMEQLPALANGLELENNAKWQRFASSLEAERDIPALKNITSFQKVLIIQVFRPDRLQSAILQFVIDLLKVESISPPPISLHLLFEEIAPQIPLLIISSTGADPSKELQEYAAKTIGLGNYEELAMGGGTQEVAIQLLRSAAQQGGWLCLKNLHLVVAWLPKLEQELAALSTTNEGFRLILTSECHNQFTSILLQQSLKVTFESPPGIKKNLQRTFDTWNDSNAELFGGGGGSEGGGAAGTLNPIRNRLLFLLACFHAIMQERRNFIPQGWTKFYEFSYGDLKAGTYVIEAITEKLGGGSKSRSNADGGLDWEIIHGLMEDAIYGGRIDNAFDLRVLRAYLRTFFSDELAGESAGGIEIIPQTPLRMPTNPEYRSFVKVINQLEEVDQPYFFNLPDNIERSLQRTNSAILIRQLRILASSDAEASKYDREKWRAQLGPMMELWAAMKSSTPDILGKRIGRDAKHSSASAREGPGGNNPSGGGGAGKGGKVNDPVDDFIVMEYELAGEICYLVDGSLSALKKVLFGSGLLTPAIQQAATSLLAGIVPAEWKKAWDGGPEKPQAWLREIVRKIIELGKLKSALSKGGSKALLASPLSLNNLFNPGTFINALRQQTARVLNDPIDNMKMICSWEKDFRRIKANADCPLPCILTNLLLQGAMFQNSTLRDSSSEAAELSPIQDVCIGFVKKSSRDAYDTEEAVPIPVYLTPSREEFLMDIQMPMDKGGEHDRWILSGVALCLSEED